MTKSEKEFILNLPREQKLTFLKELCEQDEFGMAFTLLNVLLEAPISKGGIETDAIKEIMDVRISNITHRLEKDADDIVKEMVKEREG